MADIVAHTFAFRETPYRYKASWLHGMAMSRGDRFLVTDERSGFDAKPMRLVGWSLPATGPEVILQSETAA
jgi:hypothetical protein